MDWCRIDALGAQEEREIKTKVNICLQWFKSAINKNKNKNKKYGPNEIWVSKCTQKFE